MNKRFKSLFLILFLSIFLIGGNSKNSENNSDLLYSTYLGGSGNEGGYGIALDKQGNFYAVGSTNSRDFPVDFFTGVSYIVKFSKYCELEWKKPAWGWVRGVALDPQGNVYVTGGAYVAKYTPDGELVYLTIIRGSNVDYGNGIAIDENGNAYITGYASSPDFPTTPGAYDTSFNGGYADAFVVKFDPSGNVVYSTYLGGGGEDDYGRDFGRAIAVDREGNAYVFGNTYSSSFPTTPGAYDITYNGSEDGFITKLNPDGTGLIYSTYWGGDSIEWIGDITVDEDGNAYVCGSTLSWDFPVTPNAYQPLKNQREDGCITKLNPEGSELVFSTYLGGDYHDLCFSIALDKERNIYLTGHSISYDKVNEFPVTPWAYDTTSNGISDLFVALLDSSGSTLLYSTYLGGSKEDAGRESKRIALDEIGDVYITGTTDSLDFPTTPNAYDNTHNGGLQDAVVAKLRIPRADLIISSASGGTTNPIPGTYNYLKGTPVSVTAIPQEGYRFKEWTGDVLSGQEKNNPITILLDADKSITANFIQTYTLIIRAGSGGTTNPGPGIYGYDEGEQISVRAIPNQGYEFANWSGDASGTNSSITLTMDSDKTITANFKAKEKPCFLSSIFGPSSKETETFRNFRDRYLKSNRIGLSLIDMYYTLSPSLAVLVSKSKPLRIAARIGLSPVLSVARVL